MEMGIWFLLFMSPCNDFISKLDLSIIMSSSIFNGQIFEERQYQYPNILKNIKSLQHLMLLKVEVIVSICRKHIKIELLLIRTFSCKRSISNSYSLWTIHPIWINGQKILTWKVITFCNYICFISLVKITKTVFWRLLCNTSDFFTSNQNH